MAMPPRGGQQQGDYGGGGGAPGGLLPANMPPGPEIQYLPFTNFKTMNTRNARIGLQPDNLAWCENMLIVGPNNLFSVPGNAINPVATIAAITISFQFDAYMNGAHHAICFGSDGSGWDVNKSTGAQTKFANAATFTNADLTVYRASRVLIVDPVFGFCTWDGTAFCFQGTISPNLTITNPGQNYTSAPTFTVSGGSGTGGSGTTTIVNGKVATMTLTVPGTGYKLGDTLTVAFSGGGGTLAAANAFIWPFLGFQPVTIDLWQGQVWIAGAANGTPPAAARILAVSGSTSQDATNPTAVFYDNFANGGTGQFSITDQDLVEGITCVRGIEDFLYILGSNSVRLLGFKSISGSPAQTSFTVTTVSSDQGTVWRRSVISFNKYVLFANTTGVHAVYGMQVKKISPEMDGVFLLGSFGGSFQPQAGVVDILGKHIFVLLFQYNDPVLGTRPIMVALLEEEGKKGGIWFILSAGNLMAISSAAVNGVWQLWGSYGGDVTQLFANTTVPVPIKLSLALFDDQQPFQQKRLKQVGISHSIASPGAQLTWTSESENQANVLNYTFAKPLGFVSQYGPIGFVNSQGLPISFASGGYFFLPHDVQASGIYIGGTLESEAINGFVLNAITIAWWPGPPMRSNNLGA